MKYFISGANGQLGKEIQDSAKEYENSEFVFFGRELNICNKADLVNYFKDSSNFDYFINCAAYTDVEKAEKEPEKALDVNYRSLKNIVKVCNDHDITLIHISTDFVFDGEKSSSYNEKDEPNPISVYGESKFKGEQLIIANCKKYVIIRTSWLYSRYGNNFVKKIIDLSRKNERISVVSDEIGTLTNAADLAKDILYIAEQKLQKNSKIISKLYHYANLGSISRYEFAKEIVKTAGIDCEIAPVNSDYFNFMAKRPKNSNLDQSEIIKEYGLNINTWDISLKDCIKNIVSDEK